MDRKKMILLSFFWAIAPGAAWADEVDAGAMQEDRKTTSESDPKQAEIDELKLKLGQLEERLDSVEEDHIAAIEDEIQESKRILDIYGFFDFSLVKSFVPKSSFLKNVLWDSLSFTLSHLNIYLSSRMTETLSALVELRFTFAPNGYETSYMPYERTDTTIVNMFATEQYRLGGVLIERVHLTWQPFDFFGITAGRFLTPFGIWNIDHGSPVLIPMLPPYLMLVQTIPLAQTGLIVQGRFFPFDKSYIEYAFTVSNGRGTMDEVFDLDDNKAVGLRLRFERDGENVDFAVGAYGYYGQTTDVTKTLIPDETGTSATVDAEDIMRYNELAGSADLVLRIYGVRLQAEYARCLKQYEVRPLKILPIVNMPAGDEYQPDYVQWNTYGLVAWDLPLDAILGEMVLTPFFLYEYSVQDDSEPNYDMTVMRFGFNFKPISFITLKLDASYAKPVDSIYITPWWIVGGQLAVSF